MAMTDGRDRVLNLAGGRNFRDLGGYQAADGRTVRWGHVYRSGTIGHLTDADWQHLSGRGVRTVCDLRSTREREAEPFRWSVHLGENYFSRDYESSFAELRELMKSGFAEGAAAREAMMLGYSRLAYDQAPAYRALFAYLKDGDVPLIVNCSAGKDRAGTASALILSALGVPRATVIEDFVLTDKVGELHASMAKEGGPKGGLSRQPVDVVKAILDADPAYINAALGTLEAEHGSVVGFLNDVLDVGPDDIERIRGLLLE